MIAIRLVTTIPARSSYRYRRLTGQMFNQEILLPNKPDPLPILSVLQRPPGARSRIGLGATI
jgi:hypothetical protein